MRPAPVAAGFQRFRPGSVSRAAKLGSSARAKRDRLSAMPLAVASLTNSRREVLMLLFLLASKRPLNRTWSMFRFQRNMLQRISHRCLLGELQSGLPRQSRKVGERRRARAGGDQGRPLLRAERDQ